MSVLSIILLILALGAVAHGKGKGKSFNPKAARSVLTELAKAENCVEASVPKPCETKGDTEEETIEEETPTLESLLRRNLASSESESDSKDSEDHKEERKARMEQHYLRMFSQFLPNGVCPEPALTEEAEIEDHVDTLMVALEAAMKDISFESCRDVAREQKVAGILAELCGETVVANRRTLKREGKTEADMEEFKQKIETFLSEKSLSPCETTPEDLKTLMKEQREAEGKAKKVAKLTALLAELCGAAGVRRNLRRDDQKMKEYLENAGVDPCTSTAEEAMEALKTQKKTLREGMEEKRGKGKGGSKRRKDMQKMMNKFSQSAKNKRSQGSDSSQGKDASASSQGSKARSKDGSSRGSKKGRSKGSSQGSKGARKSKGRWGRL